MSRPAIIVHGGAGPIPDEHVDPYRQGCATAAKLGWQMLLAGGSAEDAVEAAIRSMEDDACFDAGRGSFLNQDGVVEMDAAMMEGRELNIGAVAGVQDLPNPITLARRVMESPHVLLVGQGASRFGVAHGLTRCGVERLVVAREIDKWRQAASGLALPRQAVSDTVGAIAMDETGHLVAGVSTGGMPFKVPGRVGDVPCVGAGYYADDAIGAAVSTGEGEAIMRVLMAKDAFDRMGAGSEPQRAAQQAIAYMHRRTGGHAGLIVLAPSGQVSFAFNTVRIACAWIQAGEVVSMVPDYAP